MVRLSFASDAGNHQLIVATRDEQTERHTAEQSQ